MDWIQDLTRFSEQYSLTDCMTKLSDKSFFRCGFSLGALWGKKRLFQRWVPVKPLPQLCPLNGQ